MQQAEARGGSHVHADRVGAVIGAQLLHLRADLAERLLPGDPFEAIAHALHRIAQPVRRPVEPMLLEALHAGEARGLDVLLVGSDRPDRARSIELDLEPAERFADATEGVTGLGRIVGVGRLRRGGHDRCSSMAWRSMAWKRTHRSVASRLHPGRIRLLGAARRAAPRHRLSDSGPGARSARPLPDRGPRGRRARRLDRCSAAALLRRHGDRAPRSLRPLARRDRRHRSADRHQRRLHRRRRPVARLARRSSICRSAGDSRTTPSSRSSSRSPSASASRCWRRCSSSRRRSGPSWPDC